MLPKGIATEFLPPSPEATARQATSLGMTARCELFRRARVIMNDAPADARLPKNERESAVRLIGRAVQFPASDNEGRIG